MRLRLPAIATLSTFVALSWLARPGYAQVDYFFIPTGTADYNVNANWLDPVLQNNFVPTFTLNERSVIDSGGVAEVSSSDVPSPGALTIGSTRAGQPGTGTLRVKNGGVLNVTTGSVTSGAISIGVAGAGTVEVQAGGTLTSTGGLSTGANDTDILIVGGSAASLSPAATLTVPVAALNGRTQVFPNAAFSTSTSAVFGANGVYTSETNTTGTGKINAGGVAVLNGTARLNFTGVTPTVGGAKFTILEANDFGTTAFSSTTSNLAFPSNQLLVPVPVDVGGGRKQLRVGLEEVLVLEVDRNSGIAKLTHPGSGSINFDSYSVASTAGSLKPGSFNGIHDQGLLGGNWIETSLTANNVGELKPNLTGTVAGGTTITLGSIYNPFSGGFAGASEEDLRFEFSRFSDGAVIRPVVKYTGTAVNNLLLQVDPTGTGDAYLRNTSQTTVQIDGYHILSTGNRLSATAWNSLDEQNVGGTDVWLENLNNSAAKISEFNQAGFMTLAPGQNYNLGKLYLGGAQDLSFEFLQMGQTSGVAGAVIYQTFVPVAGDYNGNGIVDAADYTIWRDTLGSTTDLRANGDNSGASAGKIDAADYSFWKSRFGATSGSGGGSLGTSQVPEPATWLLVALSGIGLASARRRSAN